MTIRKAIMLEVGVSIDIFEKTLENCMSSKKVKLDTISPRLFERCKFIEFRLFWEGAINRNDLTEEFGISMPQATLDLKSYQDFAPGNLAYDLGKRCYYPADTFKPKFGEPDPQEYLSLLNSENKRVSPLSLGKCPAVETLPAFKRPVSSEILREILLALRNGERLHIKYQSPRSPENTDRWVFPLVMVYTLGRWQLRTYCHRRKAFRSFVLGRIISVHGRKEETEEIPKDIQWNREVTVEVVPNKELCKCAKQIIEQDYGMANGRLSQRVRHALLEYFLLENKLLDNLYGEPGGERNLIADNGLITITNVKQIQSYLDEL